MRIANTEYSVAPKDNPLVYPGKIPDFSYLYFGEYFYRLRVPDGRRLGQARIVWSLERPDDIKVRTQSESLKNRLLRMNATSMEFRYPIAAYGSNASPSQLERKYWGEGSISVIPVVRGTIFGIDVVYSAHMSVYGAIPATVVASPSVQTEIHVTFVDRMQLGILDDTEPNYVRVRVDGHKFPLRLESGETLSEYYVYLSRHGVLLLDGQPRHLAVTPASQSSLESATEKEILCQIVDRWNQHFPHRQFDNVIDLLDKVRDDQVANNELTTWIKENFATSDIGIPRDSISKTKVYRHIVPRWPGKRQDDMFMVLPNWHRSPGEYAVAVHPNIRAALRLGRYVVVEHAMGDRVFSLMAELSDQPVQNKSEIRVDQTIRNSLGVEIGENIRLHRIADPRLSPWQRLFDKLLPRRYLVMRVQSADVVMMEKATCAMPQIALQFLGIEAGDEVVFESAVRDGDHYKIVHLTLRAYPTPESTQELRESAQGGMFLQTRFPDCAEVFGVLPDLPWVFIDADARNALGLSKCSPVRVRASRWYQIVKDFRDYSFLILVSLLSAISLLDIETTIPFADVSIPLNLFLIGPGILIAALLVFLALRKRLS